MNACMVCLEDTESTEAIRRTVSVDLPGTHCTYGREVTAELVQAGIVCEACAFKENQREA